MPQKSNSETPSKIRSILLAVTIATSVAIAFYAATTTATADEFVRPYATALGVALIVILLIGGFVNTDMAKDGFLPSVLSSLPRLYRWGLRTTASSVVVGAASLFIAAMVAWIGPGGLMTFSVACDEAKTIEIAGRPKKYPCNGALSISMWLSPIRHYEPIDFLCFDSDGNPWQGNIETPSSGICGDRPQNASYVTNGIPSLPVDSESVVGRRTTESVHRLRDALGDGRLPDRRLKDRFLFATWNIRDLGRDRFRRGKRLKESYAYIAEIISHFDVVAIQEVRDRPGVDKILFYLGDNYKAEFGFFAPGPAGNKEQQGFIYDSRKVALGRLSTTLITDPMGEDLPGTGQPVRPPFLAEFIVNGRALFLVTTHIYYGSQHGEKFERRLTELRVIGKTLRKMVAQSFPNHPVVLAGDLNVSVPDGREMKALLDAGFESDPTLASLPSNFNRTRPYDQILVLKSDTAPLEFGAVGVFPVFDYVFRDHDWSAYKIDFRRIAAEHLEKIDPDSHEREYQRTLRTFQISDHFPKWAEFRLDALP